MNASQPNTKSDAAYRHRMMLLSAFALVALLGAAPGDVDDCKCECQIEVQRNETRTISTNTTTDCVCVYGTLKIAPGVTLTINGAGDATTSTIDGRVYLQGSGSTLRITDNDHTLIGSGEIIGQNNGARITISDALTLTSEITIEGTLLIDDAPGASATFANNGLIHANRTSADWVLTVATATINDSSGNRWQVSANASAVLRFGSAATGLAGRFDVDNGTLDIDADVTTGGVLDFQGGKIEVAPNMTFQAG